MRRAYKYRIYPTGAQESLLENSFSMCRHLYNWNLQERIETYQKENRSVTYLDQQNALPELKKNRPWFKGVYSLVLQDVVRRLDAAYSRFFDKKGGFPKYKKKGDWNSITYADHRKVPDDGYLKVAKVGLLKIVYHRDIPQNAKIKTLSIIKEGGKWFASFSLDLPDQPEPKQQPTSAIGIDLGLKNFIFDSLGDWVEAPRFLKERMDDLERLQRKLSRTEKRTPAYFAVLRALQKVHYKIRCMRNDYYYKIAHKLFEKADLIVHENLSIPDMIKGKFDEWRNKKDFNRSIYDAGWGMFIQILESVGERLRKHVLGINPAYTSQTCSECGSLEYKGLSTRTHHCTSCGYITDRDHNAAKNILRLGLESLGLSQEAPTIMRSI